MTERPRHTIDQACPSLWAVLVEHQRRKLGQRYAQSSDQMARGAEFARRITGESLDFKPVGDRYPVDEKTGQYELGLPKPQAA